jgi:predicted MFS family arabinose efflux permease
MSRAGDTVAGVIAGIILLDLGSFAAQVANQTRVLSIDAAARSRIFSVYLLLYYAAGVCGSLAGPALLAAYGWSAICALGAALGLTGLIVLGVGHRQRSTR